MKYLAALMFCFCTQALAGPKLYVFDCGLLNLESLELFGIAPDESSVRQMFVPCYLIEHENGLLLWDGGLPRAVAEAEGPVSIDGGSMVYDHWIVDQLADMGLTPGDIDYMAFSHLHFDHAGGLLSAYEDGKAPELLFPNAKYLVSEKHWQRAVKPHPRDRASFIPKLNALLEQSGRLVFVNDSSCDLLPGVTFEFTDGHTPGMMHSTIADVVFCADLIPGKAWIHVPISMGYDRFPELLIDEKTNFLNEHSQLNHRFFFTHDPEISVAKTVLNEGRFSTTDEQKILLEER